LAFIGTVRREAKRILIRDNIPTLKVSFYTKKAVPLGFNVICGPVVSQVCIPCASLPFADAFDGSGVDREAVKMDAKDTTLAALLTSPGHQVLTPAFR
jgi:hypothetical protein